jgi:hypothetical protein
MKNVTKRNGQKVKFRKSATRSETAMQQLCYGKERTRSLDMDVVIVNRNGGHD